MLTVAKYQQMDKLELVDLKPDHLITLLVKIKLFDIIIFCDFLSFYEIFRCLYSNIEKVTRLLLNFFS